VSGALQARIVTALLLVTGLLAALFWLPALGWKFFVAGLAGLAAWEWSGLSGFPRAARAAYAVIVAAATASLAMIAFPSQVAASAQPQVGLIGFGYLLALGFWLLLVPVWLLQKWRLEGWPASGLVGAIVLVPAALAMVHLRESSPLLLLAAMATVWIADIAAYFVGRRFGRRKLAPSVSPGKTWEGALGAAVAVVCYGMLVSAGFGQSGVRGVGGHLLFALLLLLVTAVSIIGDLFESLMKRQAGVKDSGSLLPGHGGVLDRIDSLTSTLPLVGLAALYWPR
jgi:phosphatidate cytidylyltransferase